MGIVVIMTLWTIIFLPETKGSDLENTFRLFQTHWFWGSKTAVKEVHSMSLPMSNDGPAKGVDNNGPELNGRDAHPKGAAGKPVV